MNRLITRSDTKARVVILLAGIAIFLISNGRWMTPFAAFIAPVLLLRYVRTGKPILSLVLLFILMALSAGVMLYGIVPPHLGVLTWVLIVYYAVLWFVPYLTDRLLASRIGSIAGTLVFPMAAVTVEFINTIIFGSWASFAYTQYENLPFIQLSSITGMWGITFMVMWFAPVVNDALEKKLDWLKIRKRVLLYSIILTLVFLYGGFRLAMDSPAGKTVKFASMTATGPLNEYLENVGEAGYASSLEMAMDDRATQSTLLRELYEKVFDQNAALMTPDVKLILWAESMVCVLEEDEEGFINWGRVFASEHNVYLLLAYFMIPETQPAIGGENKAILISHTGKIEWEYLKAHPVPGVSDKPGDRKIPVTKTLFGKISAAICYDMDFTGLIHQAGMAGTDIMLVPAWDWKEIDPLHARMAVFRAIENGFSMVRQTGEGLSIAVDHHGRTRAYMDHFTTDNHTMISRVPVDGVWTVYSLIGDLFAWLCVGGLVILISIVIVARRKKSSS